jgi:2-C-methyl-D-erythritol 4-phosphate cytidylyltransferase
LAAFAGAGIFDRYIFVHRDDGQKNTLETHFKSQFSADILSAVRWVRGGENRTNSVFNGLQLIGEQLSPEAFVFIHDGARPLISTQNILRINGALSEEYGVVLAHRTTDTILLTAAETRISGPNPTDPIPRDRRQYCGRDGLWIIETPQAFYFPKIFQDHRWAHDLQLQFSDDSSLFSGAIKIIESHDFNPKITFSGDLEYVGAVPLLRE